MFWKKVKGVCWKFLSAHWKSILYYGAVAAVLCAVAYAAEEYRKDAKYTEMVLPAVDINQTINEGNAPEIKLPEGMRVMRAYSEQPVWNEILQQWENHMAVDLEASDDDAFALCSGVVGKIGCDSRIGNYVEIESGDLVLRYGSVSAGEDTKEGDKIEAGERFGTADNSMNCEAYLGKHVHLEVIYKEEITDAGLFMSNGIKAAANS